MSARAAPAQRGDPARKFAFRLAIGAPDAPASSLGSRAQAGARARHRAQQRTNEDGPRSARRPATTIRYSASCGDRGNVEAIEQVIASFGAEGAPNDQIFVQPMLERVAMAGVAFSRPPSGAAPTYIVNYDDRSGRTDGVTGGIGGQSRNLSLPQVPDRRLSRRHLPRSSRSWASSRHYSAAMRSMSNLPSTADGQIYLASSANPGGRAPGRYVRRRRSTPHSRMSRRKVELLSRPHPFLHGSRSIFGVMPDWNPAEIIGLRPWPLSLSLYRELITDAIWAYQRDNYGYKNLRSFPLLVSFHGLPYIDVRVSFNSFVPRDVPDDLAGRLVNYYIDRLLAEPQLHDKVEFEIIFSCYTLDLPQRLEPRSRRAGFSQDDIAELSGALRRLTNRIIHGETALWRRDRAKIDLLAQRLPMIGECEDRQDQPHLLAARGLQALRHPAVCRTGASGFHRRPAAALVRRDRRAERRGARHLHGGASTPSARASATISRT